MPDNSLTALIVTTDRAMLRLLSRFLQAFGYKTLEAAETSMALTAMDCRRPDFVLIDEHMKAQGAFELCGIASQRFPQNRPHFLLLVDRPDTRNLTEALSVGFDDFLAKPIVHGELLARMRAGAKSLEHNRRVLRQAHVDPFTELPGVMAVLEKLGARRESPSGKPTACILLDIDYFHRVARQYGDQNADELLRQFAKRLQEFHTEQVLVGHVEGNRFAVVLTGQYLDQAVAWAKRVCTQVSDFDWALAGQSIALTVSSGVAVADEQNNDVHHVFQQATTALRQAKTSGRGCVVSAGEFEFEESAWSDLSAPGRLFEQTLARDVMTSCTVMLHAEDSIELALALFQRTTLLMLPVVGADGKLIGSVHCDAVREIEGAPASTDDPPPVRVEEVMNLDTSTLDESACFAELTAYFVGDVSPVLFVVRNGRPTGFVTRDELAALSQPASLDTFATEQRLTSSSRYLLVAEER